MDSKNFAIGILSTTAVILFVGLLVIQTRPQPAWASGMSIVSGDFAMSVGALTRDDEDLLYLIDGKKQLLNVYRFDIRSYQIELVQTISLKEMRKMGKPPSKKKKRSPRPRKRKP